MGNPLIDGEGNAAHLEKVNWLNSSVYVPDKLPFTTKLNMNAEPGEPPPQWYKSQPASGEINWDKNISMGFSKDHPFSSKPFVFPRKFRFTVDTELNTKFQYYVKNVEIDWVHKRLKMDLYETTDFDTGEVLEAYSNPKNKRPLVITLYDGCGKPIMGYRFNSVALQSWSTPLDYADSDVVTNKAILTYRTADKLKRPVN